MENYGGKGLPFATHDIWDIAAPTPPQEEDRFSSYIPALPETKLTANPFSFDDFPNVPGPAKTPFDLTLDITEFDTISADDVSWGTDSLSTIRSEEQPVEDDIWDEALHLDSGHKLQTWEAFLNAHCSAAPICYLSESSTHFFDALVQAIELTPRGKASKPILLPFFIEALKNLTRGRESRLFCYNDVSRKFDMRLDDARISGYTLESSQHLIEEISQYASATKELKQRIHGLLSPRTRSTTLTTLGSAIMRAMTSMEYLFESLIAEVSIINRLQSCLLRPTQLVALLSETLDSVEKVDNEVGIISTLWTLAVRLEEHQSWMFPIIAAIHEIVSGPWSCSVDAALSLPNDDASALAQHVDGAEAVNKVPIWIDEPTQRKMQDIFSSIQLLKRHGSSHPLFTSRGHRYPLSISPRLRITDIHTIQSKAANYEMDLKCAMRSFDSHHDVRNNMPPRMESSSRGSQWNVSGVFSKTHYADIAEAGDPFPLVRLELEDVVMQSLDDAERKQCTFSLPISLAFAMHCGSVISTQAQLVNQACLNLMFKDHNLRAHLLLQQRFYMLNDGVFASRLAHALFNADLPSTERRKGHRRIGTAGLRLGQRDFWPPASSELRLALRGILTDCCDDNNDLPFLESHGELPGNLSFSVRSMSEDALQRCMDPNNVEALDFLSLQYQAPEPIDAIVTDKAIGKYDLIFKQLLRCQRMLHTVKQLCNPGGVRGTRNRGTDLHGRRFRIEAQHIVSSICGYFHDRIATEIQHLNAGMEETNHRIETYSLLEDEGPQSVREFHEKVLDRILFALFLRKRQAQLLKLLEEIFTLILVFAREEHEGTRSKARSRALCSDLHGKIVRFIRTCTGLLQRKDHAPVIDGRTGDGENMLGQLLSVLNMNDYYKL